MAKKTIMTDKERPKKTIYMVVQEIGKVPFEKMVNEWIDVGFVCVGGCDCKSISANPNGWIFTQALIKL